MKRSQVDEAHELMENRNVNDLRQIGDPVTRTVGDITITGKVMERYRHGKKCQPQEYEFITSHLVRRADNNEVYPLDFIFIGSEAEAGARLNSYLYLFGLDAFNIDKRPEPTTPA